MESSEEFTRSGYWYPDAESASTVDVLNLLRRYRSAETAMRARTRSSMRMNETDLVALRFLLREQRAGRIVIIRIFLAVCGGSGLIILGNQINAGFFEKFADFFQLAGGEIEANKIIGYVLGAEHAVFLNGVRDKLLQLYIKLLDLIFHAKHPFQHRRSAEGGGQQERLQARARCQRSVKSKSSVNNHSPCMRRSPAKNL